MGSALHNHMHNEYGTLIKKKIKFSSYIRKFRMEQLQSHIWLTASSYTVWWNICAFPHILGSPSSYMTLRLLHSEFPYIWGKFVFLFCQCTCTCSPDWALVLEKLIYVMSDWEKPNKFISSLCLFTQIRLNSARGSCDIFFLLFTFSTILIYIYSVSRELQWNYLVTQILNFRPKLK